MSLIMPNRRIDTDVDVTSASNSCDMHKYDVFNFEESPRKRMDDGSIQNLLQLSTYNEREDNNLEHLKLNMLPANMFEEIQSSMNDWEEYMYCKEHEVLTKSILNVDDVPNIRSCDAVIQYPERNNVNNSSFTCSKIEIRSHEDTWTDELSEEQKSMKVLQADAEKCRGNKAYKAGDFIKACEHYSNSISLIPSIDAYNNRAQANIKLQNYSSALPDVNEVLKGDPLNPKALFRRAICRMNFRMFHEALCDIQTLLDLEPKNKDALSTVAKIRKEIASLKGRKYRMRLIINLPKTFDVDVSQLPIYAQYEGEYVLEVDKSGCAKSCVCGYCIAEDHSSRYRSNTLRIKERARWQRLTTVLLKELRLDVVCATATVASSATNNHSNGSAFSVTTNNHRSERTKNEHSKLVDKAVNNGQKTNADKFYEKQVRDKNLVNAAHNSSKMASGNLISTATANAIALPAPTPSISQTKLMKDSQNRNHQRLESTENAIQSLRLESLYRPRDDVAEILKNCSPASLKRKFDSRLNEETLSSLIHFVCETFQPEKDWSIMSQYLKEIATLERFRIIIRFIDTTIQNELVSMFRKAINMNLENAADLKNLYF